MAPKGNEYYKLRSSNGAERIFKTPEELGEKANEYFQWCIENPFLKQEIVKYRDDHTKDSVEIMRPFSLEGLCNYLGIVRNTFKNYKKRDDFLIVTHAIQQIIDTQQFEGAAAGLFNSNIIARKLGLIDSQDLTSGGEPIKQQTIEKIVIERGVKSD